MNLRVLTWFIATGLFACGSAPLPEGDDESGADEGALAANEVAQARQLLESAAVVEVSAPRAEAPSADTAAYAELAARLREASKGLVGQLPPLAGARLGVEGERITFVSRRVTTTGEASSIKVEGAVAAALAGAKGPSCRVAPQASLRTAGRTVNAPECDWSLAAGQVRTTPVGSTSHLSDAEALRLVTLAFEPVAKR